MPPNLDNTFIEMQNQKRLETYRGLVMAHEIDSNKHMNVQYYTTRFDQASGQFLAQLGFDFQKNLENHIGFAYVETTIRYKKEVMEDEPIHIESVVESIGNKVVSMKHELFHSVTNDLCADCISKWVLFDTKIRKAIPVTEELRKKLETWLVEE